MKTDDPRILDTEILFRLVPPVSARRNSITGIVEITSSVFHTDALLALRVFEIGFQPAREADAASGRVARSYGVVVFSASFVRDALGWVLCIEDEPEYPPGSHVGIYRDNQGTRLSGRQYKILTAAAHLALPPRIP